MESTGVLGEDFYNADFELYDRVMSGTEEKNRSETGHDHP